MKKRMETRLLQTEKIRHVIINYGTYIAAGANVTNHYYHHQEEPIDPDEPLAHFIYDEKLLRRVIRAAEQCTSTGDVNDKVIGLLRQSRQVEEEVLRKKEFLQARIPHLISLPEKPTVQALYKAIKRKM